MTRAVRNTGKTVSEAEFRRMWRDSDLTVDQIAERLGITRQAVSCRAAKRNLEPRKVLADARKASIRDPVFADMWVARVRFSDLAAHYGVCGAVIWKTAARLGLPKRGKNRWHTITIQEFREGAMARALAASAAQTREAMRRANAATAIPSTPRRRTAGASDLRATP